ncbi:MAG: hypothetical protein ABIA63_05760 [bacterium]
MVTVIIVAVKFQRGYIIRAHEIILIHEFDKFKQFQILNYNTTGEFIGSMGQTLGNDDSDSSLSIKGLRPSKEVSIVILSGDGKDPSNPSNPFIIQAKHSKINKTLSYNLTEHFADKR